MSDLTPEILRTMQNPMFRTYKDINELFEKQSPIGEQVVMIHFAVNATLETLARVLEKESDNV